MKPSKRLLLPVIVLLLVATGAVAWQQGLVDRILTAKVTLNWTTENSIDVAGYNLYRAATADGEGQRINADPILAGSDPFVSSEHEYVDTDGLTRGQTYYYWLESVDRLGNTSREGPIAIRAR